MLDGHALLKLASATSRCRLDLAFGGAFHYASLRFRLLAVTRYRPAHPAWSAVSKLSAAGAAVTFAFSSGRGTFAAEPSAAKIASDKTPSPLRLLILGGTGFTGPFQVRYALRDTMSRCSTEPKLIRPIRDEVGVAGGVGNLPWQFMATPAAMLIANALFQLLLAGFHGGDSSPLHTGSSSPTCCSSSSFGKRAEVNGTLGWDASFT
jgi:hypothetical protein